MRAYPHRPGRRQAAPCGRPSTGLALALIVLGAAVAPMAPAANAAATQSSVLTPDGGRYTGPLQQGARSGQGRVDWDNGAYYVGGFARGLFSGQGHYHRPSGDDYLGNFERGLESGQGVLHAADGSSYRGEFRNGLPEGEGRYEDGHGSVYVGHFRAGRFEGSGRLSSPDGVFTGEFRAGALEGQGEARFRDGRHYLGRFSHGRFHGQGRYESADAEQSYEGDFVEGAFTGQGTFTSKEGGTHVGRFVEWRPEGEGRYVDSQGNVYEGRFRKGELQGTARLRYRDGSRYDGEVKDWLPNGMGEFTRPDGDVYRGTLADGLFEGQGTLTFALPRPDGTTREEGQWHQGRLGDAGGPTAARANIETALYNQPALLERAIAQLRTRDPGGINLFLLEVAGDGTEEVFRREVDFVHEEFDARFGTRGHSLQLINSRSTIERSPLATVTSIRRAVAALAGRMDRDKDILFVFLTSHGSRSHELMLDLDEVSFPPLGAEELGRILRDSGIRWKVVVVSACYGGGFIAPLRDGNTLVLTAARQDRSSFGCSDSNDFTYFGRAFFHDALPLSGSFQDAFARARDLITAWENPPASGGSAMAAGARDGAVTIEPPPSAPGGLAAAPGEVGAAAESAHSLPQIENPAPIEAYLRAWWAQAAAAPRACATAEAAGNRPGADDRAPGKAREETCR